MLLNTSIHGLTRSESLEIYDAIVEYSGLRHFMDVPLKNYSSGMHMRLGFAIAAKLDPDVLLLDEIFAVGDEDFQKQCMLDDRCVPGARQDDPVRLAFVDGGPGHLPPRLPARPRAAAVRWTGRCRPDRIPADDCGVAARRHRPARDRAGRRRSSRRRRRRPELIVASPRRPEGAGTSRDAWVFDFLRRQGLTPRSLRARSRLRQPVGRRPTAAVHATEPLLGLREEHGALHRGRADRAAARRRRRRARPLHRQRRVRSVARAFTRSTSRLPDRSFGGCRSTASRGASRRWCGRWRPAAGSTSPGPTTRSPRDFEPIVQPRRHRTYSDREPFHYSFEILASHRRDRRRPRRTARGRLPPARRVDHGDPPAVIARW